MRKVASLAVFATGAVGGFLLGRYLVGKKKDEHDTLLEGEVEQPFVFPSENPDNKVEMGYILGVRTDLDASPNELCEYATKAMIDSMASATSLRSGELAQWYYHSQKKIAIEINGEEALRELVNRANAAGIGFSYAPQNGPAILVVIGPASMEHIKVVMEGL